MDTTNKNSYYELEIECSKVKVDEKTEVFPRFNILGQTQFKVDDSTIPATMSGFYMQREVNTQCKIEATLTIPEKHDISLMRKIINELIDKRVTIYYGGKIVSTNYYIFEVKPRQEENRMKVDLTIFSADKYLTIKKYSKVYTAKKLGEEIFNAELAAMGKTDYEYNGMLLLRYLMKGLENTTAEIIQPYLVQYNESFYDFILRTANRCGEFLFFENGTLHLGIGTKDQTQIRHLYEEECYSIEYSSEDFEEETINESDFYNSSFHSDINSAERTFSMETTTDEYLQVIEKSKYDSLEGEKTATVPWQMALTQLLTHAEGLGGFFAGNAITMLRTYMPLPWYLFPSLYYLSNLANEEYDEKYFSKDKSGEQTEKQGKKSPDEATVVELSDQYDKNREKLAQFSTLGELIDVDSSKSKFLNNLDVLFYSIIRKLQNRLSHKEITLKYTGECKTEFHLGDEFEFEKKYYVVKSIKAQESSQTAGAYNLETEVVLYPIHLIDDKTDIAYHLPIAPKANVDVTKKIHGGMEAEVVDNQDPLRLSRVRVKYLWSGSTEAETSPWIRVIAPQSTPDGGSYFLPQNGDRVMLEFENENIEKPFVVGSVFTEERDPVWGMRTYSGVISSSHGHSIRFYSSDNRGLLLQGFLPAADMLGSFIPSATTFKGADKDYELKMLGGIEMCDSRGIFSVCTSSDHRNITVDSPFGTVVVDAFTGINVSAPNGDITIEGKNIEIVAGNKISVKSGSNLSNKFTKKDIVANIDKAFTDKIYSLIDMPLLRTTLQYAFNLFGLNEAENSILIKSARNLDMEIGTGEVFEEEGSFKDDEKIEARANLSSLKDDIREIISAVADSIKQVCIDYKYVSKARHNAVVTLRSLTLTEDEVNKAIKKVVDDKKGLTKEELVQVTERHDLTTFQIKSSVKALNSFSKRLKEVTLQMAVDKFNQILADNRQLDNVKSKATTAAFEKLIFKEGQSFDKYFSSLATKNDTEITKFKRVLKLAVIQANTDYLKLPDGINETQVTGSSDEWNKFVGKIKIKVPDSDSPFLEELFDVTDYKKIINRKEFMTPDTGKIRISDKLGDIVTFDGNAQNNASVLKRSSIGNDLIEVLHD